MLERIIRLSIRHRWLVLVVGRPRSGGARRLELPAPADRRRARHHQRPGADQHRGARLLAAGSRAARSPSRSRRRSPACRALEYTRSLSRYGLSQVTVVFEDGTDIYFARQLVNERLQAARGNCPPGIEPSMGPIATGLGEIFMYTVEAEPGRAQAGRQRHTRRGSAHGAGLGRPAAAAQRAGRHRGQHHRRLSRSSIHVTPDPGRLAGLRPDVATT